MTIFKLLVLLAWVCITATSTYGNATSEVARASTPTSNKVLVTKEYKVKDRENSCTAKQLNDVFKGVLANKGAIFIEAENKYGISALFLASLAIHESANGNSNIAKKYFNCFGLKGKKFKTVRDSVMYTAKLLVESKYYRDKMTIKSIQRTYAPLNDSSLNKHWTPSIVKTMNNISKNTW